MTLTYPGFVVPQPTTTKLSDLLRMLDEGIASGKAERAEREAPGLIRQLYDQMGTPPSNGPRPELGGPGQPSHESSITAPPTRSPDVVQGSHAATAGAVDPTLTTALAARYPAGQVTDGTMVADVNGADPVSSYMASVAQAESGGNLTARNPRSSATGPFQFLEGTWNDLMRTNPELGLTPDGRTDPEQSRRAMRVFTTKNAQALKAAGVPPSPAALYAAHFLGAGAAPKVLTAAADTPMTALVSPDVIAANPHLADMTQADFVQWAAKNGGNASGGYQPPTSLADGSFPQPMAQVPRPSGELMQALFANPVTRPLAVSIFEQGQKAQTVDQFHTFAGPDNTLYSANLRTGEVKVVRDASKTPETFKTLTDPAERAAYGIPPNDTAPYQIGSDGQLHKVGGNGTTVNVGAGEGQYDKTLNENLAKTFIATQEASQSGQKTLTTLGAMQQQMTDPNFYSGFAAEPAMAVKSLVASLGLAPEAATSMQAFNSLSNQAALDLMGGSLGSGFSNADRDFVVGQVPNLSATPEGNGKMIQILTKLSERKIEIGRLASQYAASHDGRLDAGWGTYLADWAEQHPLFAANGATGGSSGGGAGGGLPDPLGIRE